jgi:ribonuclease HII
MMRVAGPALKPGTDKSRTGRTRSEVTGQSGSGSGAGAPVPRLANERRFLREGFRLVAGVDEVGRGAWAGPLSVGVAVVDPSRRRIPTGLRDSKLIPEETREAIFDRVGTWCAAWSVGHATPDECDRLGMTAALRLATRRAFAGLPDEARPDAVVLDGNFDYVSPPAAPTLFDDVLDEVPPCSAAAVRTLVKADTTCASVAAASVLAKVTRDRMMRDVADSFPPFEFERNKGYPSPTHKRALAGYGLSAIHRRSWVFADHLPWR